MFAKCDYIEFDSNVIMHIEFDLIAALCNVFINIQKLISIVSIYKIYYITILY